MINNDVASDNNYDCTDFDVSLALISLNIFFSIYDSSLIHYQYHDSAV